MDHPFRSSAFGGFNRQDVLNYLENTTKEAAQQQQDLQQQLEQANEAAARQQTALDESRSQVEHLTYENGDLKAHMERASADLAELRDENTRLTTQLAAANEELTALRARVAELEPDALAYRAVKERTAGVELEAHGRAQRIVSEAEEQARQIRQQAGKWLLRVETEYRELCMQTETTIAHAADQLNKAGSCLENIKVMLNEQAEGLDGLEQAFHAADPVRAAAPMPIPEVE